MKKNLFLGGGSLVALLVFWLGMAHVASAANPTPPALVTNATNLGTSLFCPIIDVMFYILIFIAVIMVIWAAYLYLTAGDDTQQVHKATKTMTYAAVAIVVGLIAFGFPSLVSSIFNSPAGSMFNCSAGSGSSNGGSSGSSGSVSS
jgi:heme/copper-type cytochrome/quinol oxidase subunit 2